MYVQEYFSLAQYWSSWCRFIIKQISTRSAASWCSSVQYQSSSCCFVHKTNLHTKRRVVWAHKPCPAAGCRVRGAAPNIGWRHPAVGAHIYVYLYLYDTLTHTPIYPPTHTNTLCHTHTHIQTHTCIQV